MPEISASQILVYKMNTVRQIPVKDDAPHRGLQKAMFSCFSFLQLFIDFGFNFSPQVNMPVLISDQSFFFGRKYLAFPRQSVTDQGKIIASEDHVFAGSSYRFSVGRLENGVAG